MSVIDEEEGRLEENKCQSNSLNINPKMIAFILCQFSVLRGERSECKPVMTG